MDKYILSAAEIEQFEGIEKQHFLNPKARRRNKSLGDLTGLSALGFHIVEIEPGYESTELHRHYHEEECIFILHGQADACIGSEVHRVSAGDFIGYRAGGQAHKLINTGKEILRCIVVGQRLEHDVADYPDKARRLYRNANMPWDMVDAETIEHPRGGKKI